MQEIMCLRLKVRYKRQHKSLLRADFDVAIVWGMLPSSGGPLIDIRADSQELELVIFHSFVASFPHNNGGQS